MIAVILEVYKAAEQAVVGFHGVIGVEEFVLGATSQSWCIRKRSLQTREWFRLFLLL